TCLSKRIFLLLIPTWDRDFTIVEESERKVQKVTSLIPIVVLLGLFSAGWIFLTGKSAFEFFTLLAFILAGIGLLAMVLLR
ncbi:hypothetical protein CGH58_25585, partial [Vibrio parahaemolyticus]